MSDSIAHPGSIHLSGRGAGSPLWLDQTISYGLAGLLGLLLSWITIGSPFFILQGGLVMDADYANAAAAFAIFVQDHWHWPLGANPDFGGVNIFYSDGAPWFAVLGKALHSLGLPAPSFHWMVLFNFILLPLFACRLLRALGADALTCALGVILLAANLIMPVRMIGAQHIALASYWLILWAMVCVPLIKEPLNLWRRWEFIAVLAIATWSHAYLAAMCALIILVALLYRKRFLASLVALAVPIALLWLIGALEQGHIALDGAKLFALDLAAYANSLNWGLMPSLYVRHDVQQGDTIIYLGTGAWLALLTVLLWKGTSRIRPDMGKRHDQVPQTRLILIAIAALGLAGFAMAFNLRIAGPVWLDLPIPKIFSGLYESFRAVGRFGGVMSYVLIIFAALQLGPLARRSKIFMMILIASIGLQIGDLYVAGTQSPVAAQKAEVLEQQTKLDDLLGDSDWSGNVFRDVELLELEQQRLIDYLLVEHGAHWFAAVWGSRLELEDVAQRSGYVHAKQGDLVIATAELADLDCSRRTRIKQFNLCLVR